MGRPPVIAYDTNRDALTRRVDAIRSVVDAETPVIGVASWTGVLLLAESAPEDTVVFIDLFSTDHVALDRPGERLIGRLARNPATAHVRPVAWSAQTTPDVVGGVHDAGARGFVSSTMDRDAERDQLIRVIAGETVWPDHPDRWMLRAQAGWATWFQEHFDLPWEPWIEPALVRLASGRERSAVVGELVDRGAARSTGHAATRMRQLSRAVVGEHRNSAVAVATGASLALSQIAAHRALAERPAPIVSLEHGARTVQTAPSLVRAAGLTAAEVDEILAIDDLITNKRLSEPAGAGAPGADHVRHERLWAAGRRAATMGAGRDDIDAVAAGILVQLDEALGAVDDARQDELYHPEGRAAAALSLLGPADAPLIDGAEPSGAGVRWRGLGPAELALGSDIDVADLHALSEAVDRLVIRRTQ